MQYDAIIIGGSFAGLSAGMMLARGRRNVCVVDAGLPRNRFAAKSHGFFGQDGESPLAMIAEARKRLLAYPSVTFVEGEVVSARAEGGHGFAVKLASGAQLEGKKLILASGLSDSLPEIPGIAERWGNTVVHCPYCHGFEFGGAPLGVLHVAPHSSHQALLIPEWGPTTYFLNGAPMPEEKVLQQLKQRKVVIEPGKIAGLEGVAPQLEGVRMADGRLVPLAGLYLVPRTRQHPLAAELGCAVEETPLGPVIKTDEAKLTTVPGVYAAGDAARIPHNATLASADGVLAGTGVHRALVFEGLH